MTKNKTLAVAVDRSVMVNNLLRAYYLDLVELAHSHPTLFPDDKFAYDDPIGFARKQAAEYKQVLVSKPTPDLLHLYQEYLKDPK